MRDLYTNTSWNSYRVQLGPILCLVERAIAPCTVLVLWFYMDSFASAQARVGAVIAVVSSSLYLLSISNLSMRDPGSDVDIWPFSITCYGSERVNVTWAGREPPVQAFGAKDKTVPDH